MGIIICILKICYIFYNSIFIFKGKFYKIFYNETQSARQHSHNKTPWYLLYEGIEPPFFGQKKGDLSFMT